jgi:hypothetical protein
MTLAKFDGLIDRLLPFRDDVFRNIPSLITSEDLLDDLSDDPRDRSFGEALIDEAREKPSDLSPIITRPFAYGAGIGAGPAGPHATRFSDGTRFGVWYGSRDLATTLYETLYHWKRRLANMMAESVGEQVSERRVFRVQAEGLLVDLRGKRGTFPMLLDPLDYGFSQAVGAYLHDQGQNGLIIESARHREGINIACFRPDLLSRVRHHGYLVYRWRPGEERVRIEKTAGRTWRTLPWA